MTTVIEEGALRLEVDGHWVIKWDEHRAFAQGLKRRQGTKAVDVVADVEGDVGPVFIEVKDFRGSQIENKGRARSGALAKEVAEKVRDTLAGLVWACDRGLGEAFHEKLTRRYLEARKSRVILWLEEDSCDIGGADALQSTIRRELKPHINAEVIVTSLRLEERSTKPLRWLRVTSLPSPRSARRSRGA